MMHINAQPGDVVVVVPRGMIILVGLLLLLIELTFTLTILFLGFATEGIFLSLFVMILAPLQLLILYIVWRYYWYLLVLGVMLQSLLSCAAMTGVARIGGNTYSILSGIVGPSALSIGDTVATTVLFAFALALFAVIVIGVLIKTFIPVPAPRLNYDVDALDKPQPRRKRSGPRDLWQDD